LKRIVYNKVDILIKELVVFFITLLFLLFGSTYIIAQDFSHKTVISEGRAVIIDGNEDLAKKRALDDALYLASLQAGAKIDGYSNIDQNTSLNENLLVRPSSSIKDFVILDQKKVDAHFVVKIKAFLVSIDDMINCSKRESINLGYYRPHFMVSSRLPAYSQKLPYIISRKIFQNLQSFDDINLKDLTSIEFDPAKISAKPVSLDYEALVEGKAGKLRNGEFGIHPFIKISSGNGRLTRFSKELVVDLNLNIYDGSNYEIIDSMDYSFSIFLGNETGYKNIDAFYNVPYEKITNFIERSLSKIQFRVMDQLRCYPLEAKINLINGQLTVPLGSDQGLKNGKVGFISNNNPDHSMNDWVVVTVRNTEKNSSVLEILNPLNKKSDINGKIIRFMN
tara:strand:+ start:503 stop:1681 length:1179 start_codon:yes stop_codon:yes gene_type:complete